MSAQGTSVRGFAILSAVLFTGFLLLRPLAGRLGEPQPPDTRGRSEAAGLPVSARSLPATASGTVSVPAPVPSPSPASPASITHLEEVERLVLELTNQERRTNGRAPLQAEDGLRAAARSHSDDMLVRGFFDHLNPDGLSPGDRIARLHRRLIGVSGENIWACTGGATAAKELAENIVNDWMTSPGHRQNILRLEFTHLGVGIASAGNEVRATQSFASVRAWLQQEVPATVESGQRLQLESSVARPGMRAAEMFDLFSSRRGLRIASPSAVAIGRIDAEPGRYKLRFYFPAAAGGFTIHPGPEIEVE